jgi:type II secretory pathway pseudopilin PulG
MRPPRCERKKCQVSSTSGFTIIEAVIVLLIVATVLGALTPSVRRSLSRARANRAANVVAADFYLAQSLAARQFQPVVVTFDSDSMLTTITNAATGATLYTRRFGTESEFKLSSFSASVASVLVLPNGMANTGVTVTLSAAGYTKQITMTRAGQVRIVS